MTAPKAVDEFMKVVHAVKGGIVVLVLLELVKVLVATTGGLDADTVGPLPVRAEDELALDREPLLVSVEVSVKVWSTDKPDVDTVEPLPVSVEDKVHVDIV